MTKAEITPVEQRISAMVQAWIAAGQPAHAAHLRAQMLKLLGPYLVKG